MTTPHPRRIKSFAIREGRMSVRQEQALTAGHYLLPATPLADWSTLFARTAPVVLEIGFGMGQSLLNQALKTPECNFVGIEVFRPGIGALLAEVYAQHITNIRVFQGDAVEVITHCVADHSLDGIQIFFADPWPKRRHHKRRLIQIPFIRLLLQKLKSGGQIHLATDWEDYAMHMMQVLSQIPELRNMAGVGMYAQDRGSRPLTKYEQRGHTLGHGVWDLRFMKT